MVGSTVEMQAGSPSDGLAKAGQFSGNIGEDGGLKWEDLVQDAESIFAHLFAREQLGRFGVKVQAELESVGRNGDA